MKVVILAGGLGTRISEESHLRPKPMIYIGEMPILVHIMKSYAAQGFKDFIICAGYKQEVIKEYFAHYFLYNNDVTYDFATNERIVHKRSCDDWKVTVVDTGLHTGTGGRIRRIRDFIGDEPFTRPYQFTSQNSFGTCSSVPILGRQGYPSGTLVSMRTWIFPPLSNV